MSDPLYRIKEAVIEGRVRFTQKALQEMHHDSLLKDEIVESILNAPCIHKRIVSRRRGIKESLYIILGMTRHGLLLYTKGRFHREAGAEVLYILISSKRTVMT